MDLAAVMLAGFIDEAIEGVIARIREHVGAAWDWLWSPIFDSWPLYWSWGVFVLIVIGCAVLAFLLRTFLGDEWSKWPRLLLGIIVAMAGAWLYGRQTMWNAMQERIKAAKKKPR